tara:strand:- start:243 stop:548 length:306 start_codon:yes stop_codon:yes gene_type:complete
MNTYLKDSFLCSLTPEQYIYMNEHTLELYKGKKYLIKDIEFIVNNGSVSLRSLMFTQYLTADFCKKYILETDDFCHTDMDYYIVEDDILKYQKHLTKNDLK